MKNVLTVFCVIGLSFATGCSAPRVSNVANRQMALKRYTYDDVVARSKAEAFVPNFPLPTEEMHPIAPLSNEALIGIWRCTQYTDKLVFLTDWRNIKRHYDPENNPQRIIEIQYDFRQDGTYLFAQWHNKTKTPFMTAQGRYTLQDNIITLSPITVGEKGMTMSQKYEIVWFSPNEIELERSEKDRVEYRNLDARRTPFYKNERCWADSKKDKFGCEWLDMYKVGDNGGGVVKMVFSLGHMIRVSPPPTSIRPQIDYELISCEREADNDFAYRFALKLQGQIEKPLQAFRNIQKEFRTELANDYAETFNGVDKHNLRVDFPKYEWKDGKIEGRAIVLTISVTSLTYDPNTRTGKLAVKVNANQYEEARKWIRKNIETLARDKNIALTTGEIPPAAKFYLGREELKDGNVLEIEFKTE